MSLGEEKMVRYENVFVFFLFKIYSSLTIQDQMKRYVHSLKANELLFHQYFPKQKLILFNKKAK